MRAGIWLVAGALLIGAGCDPAPSAGSREDAAAIVVDDPALYWNSATIYFLLTDRFENGNPANDTALGRARDGAVLRSYQGGDLPGILRRIEEGYFDSLGVNAIWLTPFVEQVHGSVDEGTGKTYGYHGYWTRDWTAVDPALGTKEDLRAMVDAAHRHGIRVLMDAVINHTGPALPGDPAWPAGWVRRGPNCSYRDYVTTVTCTLVATLPDILTESNDPVELPPELIEKWRREGRLDQEQASLDAFFSRTGYPRAPRYYVIKWLTDWVREFGFDGYRVDTAKHFEETVSAELKREAALALADWRRARPSPVVDTLPFYMMGEVYGYGVGPERSYNFGDRSVDFFAHGYDGLINFGFKAEAAGPLDSVFAKYSAALTTGALRGVSIVNYISSHDDGGPLDPDRADPLGAGTKLLLAPGGAQIYYGDELARALKVPRAEGDANLRSFMNWSDLEAGGRTAEILAHWRKLGRFRRAHPAVGAGTHRQLQAAPYVFSRTLETARGVDRVVIAMDQGEAAKTIPVAGVFPDGTRLHDAYSGMDGTVRDGRISLTTPFGLLLLSEQRGKSSATETISIQVSEGTRLAFDLSPDGRRLVFDLLGQLWEVDAEGGKARPLTNAVRDTAEDLDPSFAPDGRRVLFRGERRGRTGMWLLTGDEPGPRQITQLPNPDGYEGNAAWSPDGKTVALVRVLPPDSASGRPRSTIALLDPLTGSTRALRVTGIPTPDLRDPAWEPGGKRIAVVARAVGAPRGGRIWIVDAAGGTATPLTAETVSALAPAFAPDGRRIAFFAPDSADLAQVWVLDLQSGQTSPRRLTSHADVSPTRVRWSADGRELFYSADGRFWRIPAAGGRATGIPFAAHLAFERPRRVLPQARFPEPGKPDTVRAFSGLALSPNGRSIGMIALGKLWVMTVGGKPRAIGDLPRTARHLAWSADGARIAWSAGRPGEEDLFATSITAGTTSRLTAFPGREVFPAWSPDGRHLSFVHAQRERKPYLRIAEAGIRELSDPGDTRIVDSVDLGWTASDVDTPQWSPHSDGLLYLSGGWSPGQPTGATFTRLSGESWKPGRVPDSPLFLRWTPQGIVFIRHTRLWRAQFDSTGMLGSAEPLGSDPAMYGSAAADGTILYISEGGLRLRAPDGRERRLGWPLSYTPPVAAPLLIRNARIIDGAGSPVTAPRDILIEAGRITGIDQPGAIDTAGRAVVDAAGRFVMPGLMDLHGHEYRPDLLPGFLYFGVMTVRDQGAPLAPLVASAEAIAAGVFDGPRVGYGALQLYTDWAYDTEEGLGIEPEADPEHATRSVGLAAALGAQHIKTRTFRRWDINARLIAEAHRRGMRATGHCAYQLPLVAAGMDAQEHAGFCDARGAGYIYDDVVQLFRAADIAMVPTIAYMSFAQRMTRPDLLDSDRELAPFLPERSSFGWMVAMNPEVRRSWARMAQRAREVTFKLSRAGVTIGTGTDIWQVPAAVHLELEELVRAGLTPLEAIRDATGSAAKILGMEETLGTIQPGKWADLVVLDADPLADIRNTRKIRTLVQAGRVVDRQGLLERFQR